jgi:tRNA(Ile)-lysidine synthase
MSRGSGITGLCGMRAVARLPLACWPRRARPLLLVRPLLGVPKHRLVATLQRAGIEYADDASNRDPRFARARLRDVMPALAREGLDASRIGLFAQRLQRAEGALESVVDRASTDVSERGWDDAGPIVLDAKRFFRLPAEIALRLLGRAINCVGEEGSLRLGKLEAIYEALAERGGEGRLRQTLAGALVTLSGTRLVVERAPPRAHR